MNEQKNELQLEPVLETGSSVCSICLKEKSRYTCPRCNIRYCSLPCYKDEKHITCSELFYKDWVMEELKETKGGREDKEKILEMLSRVESDDTLEPSHLDSDDDDDDEETDLETRLHGLDLDDSEAILKRLTNKERQEFEKLLHNGCLGNLVEIWTPWWTESKDLIEEVEQTDCDKKKDKKKSCKPVLLSNIPDISTLIKVKPSSDIRNNMINILYSYAFICRLHNGGHFDNPVESAEDLLTICSVLRDGKNFIELDEVIDMTLQQVEKESKRWEITVEFKVSVLEDVERIVHGPDKRPSLDFMLLALSDLTRLLQTANKIIKQGKSKSLIKTKRVRFLVNEMRFNILLFCSDWANEDGHNPYSVL
ncbi:zinc finger HIT domain-containing protein 2 [Patella vulgata]|uniref:zinc finger HIT domain-containing protein 2 n=1 Tax=Patella vulgata TaxID=6465 RepID=UPI0024A8C429|nr:zinc finger HIT domain-containing protein 2 [Patella vulgata]